MLQRFSSDRRHFSFSAWIGFFCLLAALFSASAQVPQPQLSIRPPAVADDWFRFSSSFSSNVVLNLETSSDLSNWRSIGTLHNALYAYPDAGVSNSSRRFYRVVARQRGADDDWKNEILYPTDSFLSTNSMRDVRWVKFAILLEDPTRVYFQHSGKYPLHYDFATQRLAPFAGMDYPSFEAVALHRTNQQVVLGSILYQPNTFPGVLPVEYGVQFVGFDPYSPEEISRWFDLVRATVYASNGATAFYMPTFEQTGAARTNTAAFAALGIPVSSIEAWVKGNTCYSPGWAVGRLKFFAAPDVVAAFSDGRLRPEDILLTDGVPADTPMVAGIISLAPSTQNSHTALLSQSFGVPFVYLPDLTEQVRVQQLAGHEIVLRAVVEFGAADVKVWSAEGLDPSLKAELLALKAPEPIDFMPKQHYGAISTSVEGLVPTDIQYFGGKAANYGFLRRAVPTNCPIAIAFSFDLWDAFLDQALPGGKTLRQEIALRLTPYTNYPPDINALKSELAVIRDFFTKIAIFTPEQQQAITNALRPFNSRRNIRFRSSTNVEDTEHFTGAGLYDSYSGCLMDDLDGDTNGPCQCDPAETKERGVFRALQKVYASFYNDDAFLERLRHGVDETKVAMGVLVHHSFPDEEELANGVATPQFTFSSTATNLNGNMVTQLGAASVTNPDGASVPEVIIAQRRSYPSDPPSMVLSLKQRSSLVPLGAYVMNWQADYTGFLDLFNAIGQGFKQFYPARDTFYLDFEYKKDANLGLIVKQVRQVPQPDTTNQTSAFLIDDAAPFVVRGGGAVFAVHHLKSIWNLHTANMRLAPTNLAGGIYAEGTVDYLDGTTVQRLSGPVNSWPNASNSPSGSIHYWTTGSGASQRSWSLETSVITNVIGAQPPIFSQNDFRRTLRVAYATPVPTPSGTTMSESVFLDPAVNGATNSGIFQQRVLSTNNVTVLTSFYWQSSPAGLLLIDTPFSRFVETRISGLVSTPIVLTNYYAQSYSAYNHSFYEQFIFEPRLEPGLPAATLAELNAANIQFLFLQAAGGRLQKMWVLGLDQVLRPL